LPLWLVATDLGFDIAISACIISAKPWHIAKRNETPLYDFNPKILNDNDVANV
jgi:hypothetical protein